MFIDIRNRGPRAGATLVEGADCSTLFVAAPPGMTEDEIGMALKNAGWGHLGAAGHTWLTIDALRERASADSSFDSMIEYAREHGWCSDDGIYVSAHIEWV
ncbi:hypothetical protein AXA44_36695 [Rhodococcus sp. SC4]|nr:hypothetical protein AXA44_36695 [Rhodococcus sp. SC4]